jgi:uncharacterized protein YlbG (UPF0298 family)
MKHGKMIFVSKNEAVAVAYAKESEDKSFLHNHILEKLNYVSGVTNTPKEELIKYFISDGLQKLKQNHYKLTLSQ